MCRFYRAEPVPPQWDSLAAPDNWSGGRWGPPYALLQASSGGMGQDSNINMQLLCHNFAKDFFATKSRPHTSLVHLRVTSRGCLPLRQGPPSMSRRFFFFDQLQWQVGSPIVVSEGARMQGCEDERALGLKLARSSSGRAGGSRELHSSYGLVATI